jgi:hypothetical protein
MPVNLIRECHEIICGFSFPFFEEFSSKMNETRIITATKLRFSYGTKAEL